ncbi:hypothetical protein PHMEG_00033618, partial [Phytophthora megakarya]
KRTQAAYSSYRRGISAWIQQNKEDSGRYFDDEGRIYIEVFTPKMGLPYSMYELVCRAMMRLEDGGFARGFARLFFNLPWNFMCRAQSVESINSGHISNQDDSIGIIFHKSKTNQDGSGPHIYTNQFKRWACCITSLAVYRACCPHQCPGPLFPGSLPQSVCSNIRGRL